MTASARLFTIELRRSPALLAIPVLLGLAWLSWYIFEQENGIQSGIWPTASEHIGLTIVFLAPAAGGLAAWAAGRERRSGLGDLLQTTPRPAAVRQLNLLAGTASWILLTYGLAALYFGISTALDATWGGPHPAPILIGALTVAAYAAMGYAAGTFAVSTIQSRLTAALVPVGLFFLELVPSLIGGKETQIGEHAFTSTYPYANLSPVELIQNLGGTIFFKPHSGVAWDALLWLGGLGGAALGLVVLRNRPRSFGAWSVVGAALVAIVAGWVQLVPAPVFENSDNPIAYTPACTQRSIEICVHPAYKSVLDDTADLVDPIIRPLVGLPGFPSRAAEVPNNDEEPELVGSAADPDTLPISPICRRLSLEEQASAVALAAVHGPSSSFFGPNPAQTVIAIWLLRQAGWNPGDQFEVSTCTDNGTAKFASRDDAANHAAADRFAALSPEEQQAWLTANLSALRAGTLTLDDLP